MCTPMPTNNQLQSLNNLYTLVHLSDLHLLSLRNAQWQELLNKRIYGLISKLISNKGKINYHLLTASIERELDRTKPDSIVFTGDITHLSLQEEYKKSRDWLDKLAHDSEIMLVPGNHDHYSSKSDPNNLEFLEKYLSSNLDLGDENRTGYFPSVQLHPPIALIGLNNLTTLSCMVVPASASGLT